MSPRAREHYEVARSFGSREFSRSEFRLRYGQEYPDRSPGSMIATDYCVNTNPKGAEALPKFLQRVGLGRYRMIDGLRPS